jgi:hypothetical protein
MYAMKGMFTKEAQADQKNELGLRIKLLREIVGQEIDRIKGTAAPHLPESWKKFQTFTDDASDEDKKAVYKHNSLVLNKKPYFFRYLYGELNDKYKQYDNMYNLIAQDRFGMKLKKLLAKQDKTPEELELVRRYQKFCPLITAPCIMNTLCKEIENIDFDIKYNKNNINKLPTFDNDFVCNEEKLKLVKSCYQKYCTKKAIKYANQMLDYANQISQDDYTEMKFAIIDSIKEELQNTLLKNNLTYKEFMFYCGQLSKSYAHFNWAFCWDMLEENVLRIIPRGRTVIPVEDPNGVEYLGRTYVLREIGSLKPHHDEEFEINDDDLQALQDIIKNTSVESMDEDLPNLSIGKVLQDFDLDDDDDDNALEDIMSSFGQMSAELNDDKGIL